LEFVIYLSFVSYIDDDEARKLVDDALYKLEHSVKDELRSKEAIPILTRLQVCQLL